MNVSAMADLEMRLSLAERNLTDQQRNIMEQLVKKHGGLFGSMRGLQAAYDKQRKSLRHEHKITKYEAIIADPHESTVRKELALEKLEFLTQFEIPAFKLRMSEELATKPLEGPDLVRHLLQLAFEVLNRNLDPRSCITGKIYQATPLDTCLNEFLDLCYEELSNKIDSRIHFIPVEGLPPKVALEGEKEWLLERLKKPINSQQGHTLAHKAVCAYILYFLEKTCLEPSFPSIELQLQAYNAYVLAARPACEALRSLIEKDSRYTHSSDFSNLFDLLEQSRKSCTKSKKPSIETPLDKHQKKMRLLGKKIMCQYLPFADKAAAAYEYYLL